MRYLLLILPLFMFASDFHTDKIIEKNSAAVIKIFSYAVTPNYYVPWSMHGQSASTGTGVVIKGNQILTAAHVVSNATYLEVQKSLDPKKYFAEVKWIAHDADLALLEVKDEIFFEKITPMTIGSLPKRQDGVAVYGYPTGGTQISITKGIVSRIEQTVYVHSAIDFLSIQIDAAINPGNSGGPAFNKSGEIVGIAMQGMTLSNSIGYIIPTPIIKHFLKDIEDGRYDGFPDDGVYIQEMENRALKQYYKTQKRSGVLVTSIIQGSSADGYLKPDDVILEVDGHAIADDNSISTQEIKKVSTNYAIKKHFIGEEVHFKILRQGKVLEVAMPLKGHVSKIPFEHEKMPRYYIFAGMVFTPLTQNYLGAWGKDWDKKAPVDFLYAFRHADITKSDDQEIVVLQGALYNKINAGYSPSNEIVKSVNGTEIHSLTDLAKIIDESSETVVVKTYTSSVYIIDVKEAQKVEQQILTQYRVSKKSHLDSK